MNERTKTKGYLYSLWNGRFMCYEGEIFITKHPLPLPNGRADTAAFASATKQYHQISTKPGIVHNATVWFPEKNDESAKKLLIEYEEKSIALLQEKIDNHRHKINILKG